MKQSDGFWTVEEVCRNAYPAREVMLESWLLRAAGGRSRRTNSVNPLQRGPRDPSGVVQQVEKLYAGLDQAAMFRVPDLAPGMDEALDRLGYTYSGRNRTLWADADAFPTSRIGDVTSVAVPDERWFLAWETLNEGVSVSDIAAFRNSVGAVMLPCVFACRWIDGTPAALAYGALDRGILVLEAVVTDLRRRREGHGRAVVTELLAWAKKAGARGACLQVAADNHPALALYQTSGFDRDLYGYHYRIAPTRG